MEELERVAAAVVDAAYQVHKALGPGLLESVYEGCLAFELAERGLHVQRQVPLSVFYKDLEFPNAFRIDLLVEDALIIEVKAVEKLEPVHHAQILTYMRLHGAKLGFLINFNVALIRDGICRKIN